MEECSEERHSGGIEEICTLTARYRAAPGEANRVTVSRSDTAITFVDPGAQVQAGRRCDSINATEVVCRGFEEADVLLGDGDDTLAAVNGFGGWAYGILEGYGGPGNDRLAADPSPLREELHTDSILEGGPGEDVIVGSEGDDLLGGGEGADTVTGGGGHDSLDGDQTRTQVWNDVLDGGPGRDQVSYIDRRIAVTVDLERADGNGSTGENDMLHGIEDVEGGAVENTLLGDAGPNELSVHGDADPRNRFFGRGGDDDLSGSNNGRDLLVGGQGNDKLDGGVWVAPDHLLGGEGDDALVGGSGPDRISGGPGDDAVHANLDFRFHRHGPWDRVACGEGNDRLIDPYRALLAPADCEQVQLDLDSEYLLDRPTLGRGGVVRVTATARRKLLACGGRLTLRTPTRYLGTPRKGRPRRRGGTPLGVAVFRLEPGKARRLTLRPTPLGQRLLAGAGPHRVEIVAEAFERCGRRPYRAALARFAFRVVLDRPAR